MKLYYLYFNLWMVAHIILLLAAIAALMWIDWGYVEVLISETWCVECLQQLNVKY